jgi:hypothetical protein
MGTRPERLHHPIHRGMLPVPFLLRAPQTQASNAIGQSKTSVLAVKNIPEFR